MYWKKSVKLLDLLTDKDEKINIDEELKLNITDKLSQLIYSESYVIAKLLIRGEITSETLYNFLLYISINKEKLYKMFVNKPDDFGKTFMFNLHPTQLPKILNILSNEEYKNLQKSTDSECLIRNLKTTKLVDLKSLFPKTYKYHGEMNKYLLNGGNTL